MDHHIISAQIPLHQAHLLCHCFSALSLSLIFSFPFCSPLNSSLLISSPPSLNTPCLFQLLSDVIFLLSPLLSPFSPHVTLLLFPRSFLHSLLRFPSTASLVSSLLICHVVQLAKLLVPQFFKTSCPFSSFCIVLFRFLTFPSHLKSITFHLSGSSSPLCPPSYFHPFHVHTVVLLQNSLSFSLALFFLTLLKCLNAVLPLKREQHILLGFSA